MSCLLVGEEHPNAIRHKKLPERTFVLSWPPSEGKSLNEAALDALALGAGVAGKPQKRRDLSGIAGTWKADKAVDAALAAQDAVDEDLWR